MNSWRVRGRLIEKSQCPRKRQIGILDPQCGCFNLLKLGLDQHRGGIRLSRQSSVPGIGDKGDFGGAGFLNPFHACNFQLRVSAQLRT